MYDKTVRRRRVVLGLLVASSLILLTAYFGESAGGGLHSVQRGVLDVVSPIQEGASKALKPVRDLFGWVGDTFDAKGELKDMRKDRDALRAQNIQLQAKLREQAQLGDQIALNNQHGLADNRPVSARVIGQDPNLWFTQITIDEGTSVGRERQPGRGQRLGARRQGHLGVSRDVDRDARHRSHDADRRDGEREPASRGSCRSRRATRPTSCSARCRARTSSGPGRPS